MAPNQQILYIILWKWERCSFLQDRPFHIQGKISAVKRVGKLSHIIILSQWCDSVLNVHAPTEDESEGKKSNFYEEPQQVFNQFPKYHSKVVRRSQFKGRDTIFSDNTD